MEWYLPITIIPGVGLLINSTTSQIMALSSEINNLVSKKCTEFQHALADKKIKQLSLVTKANFFLYLSIAFYVFSGILAVVTSAQSSFSLPNLALYIGTLSIFMALILLTLFSFRAVKIRQEQFEYNGHEV